MTGLMQAVPDDPDTIVVIESTANGVGGEFHRLWQEANDPTAETDWVPLFFAWFDHPEYCHRFTSTAAAEAFQRSLTQEESELAATLQPLAGTTLLASLGHQEQLPGLGGRVPPGISVLPDTEAFLFSGRPRFSLTHLARMPIVAGRRRGRAGRVLQRPQARFSRSCPRRSGAMVLYKKPVQGHRYVMGIDICEGIDANEDARRGRPRLLRGDTCSTA